MLRSLEKIVKYRSTRKIKWDRPMDSLGIWLYTNIGSILGINTALDYVSKNASSHEDWAMAGTYATGLTMLTAINVYLLPKILKKTWQFHNRRFLKGQKTTSLSWLKTGAGVLGLAALLPSVENSLKNFRYDGERVLGSFVRPEIVRLDYGQENLERVLPAYPVKLNGGMQSTGALQGVELSDLFMKYAGIKGVVPEKVNIDFKSQLSSMWKEKIDKSKNKVVEQVFDEQVSDYLKSVPKTMTIDDYVNQVSDSIREVRINLNWGMVKTKKNLSEPQMELLRAISYTVTARDLLSFSLSELMPSRNGNINVAVLDFLLRAAGREYVELLPALGDKETSFGLYQFTKYAVFDTGNEVRGASIINRSLPKNISIPGSVRYLNGNDHHKAAYLNAINNLAEFIKRLDRSQVGILQVAYLDKKRDLAAMIGLMHHSPEHGINAGEKWLNNGAKSSYVSSVNKRKGEYARKTVANFDALYHVTKSESRIRSREDIDSIFNYIRTNHGGFDVFRYQVKPKDGAMVIARKFNEWDKENKDRYHTVTFKGVVRVNGVYVGNTIEKGDTVYVLAKKK
jgi:hypothetical protein